VLSNQPDRLALRRRPHPVTWECDTSALRTAGLQQSPLLWLGLSRTFWRSHRGLNSLIGGLSGITCFPSARRAFLGGFPQIETRLFPICPLMLQKCAVRWSGRLWARKHDDLGSGRR
jgi:hypothetical protein